MADTYRTQYSAQKKAYDKEVYNWRKAHKICVDCGHEDAQNGHLMCLQCRMKANEYGKRYYHEKFSDEQRYRKRQHEQRRYDLLCAFGVCTYCGKRDAVPGKTMCQICLVKKIRYNKAQTIKQGGQTREMIEYSGGCYFCGEPVLKGKKICQRHYNMLMANLKKADGCIDREHHPFRRDNDIVFGNYDRR